MDNVNWFVWLVETGEISAGQLEEAAGLARLRSMPLPDALLALGYADRWAITRAFSVQLDYPQIDFYAARVPDEVIRAVPDLVARDLEVCPVSVAGPVLWYATPHIVDASRRDRLCSILNRDARPMWAPIEWVREAEREYDSAWQVTEDGCASQWAKYGDEHWLLAAGNRCREYVEAGRS